MKTQLFLIIASCITLLPSPGSAQQDSENKSPTIFDVNVTHADLKAGQYVLCPSRQFYDGALKKGIDKTTSVYYAAKLVAAGDEISTVQNLAGRKFELPNQLIVPIPAGQKAAKGDIVLSWWQSGSGMQRAIVVGGSETEPVVRFLDVKLDNPSGVGKNEEKLKKDSFYVLNKPFQLGTTVAVKTKNASRHGQIVAIDKQNVIVREFAGKMNCYPRKDCEAIPIKPDVNANETAMANVWGSMKPVSVDRVDSEIGRVFVTFQLGRKDKSMAISFGDIVGSGKQ